MKTLLQCLHTRSGFSSSVIIKLSIIPIALTRELKSQYKEYNKRKAGFYPVKVRSAETLFTQRDGFLRRISGMLNSVLDLLQDSNFDSDFDNFAWDYYENQHPEDLSDSEIGKRIRRALNEIADEDYIYESAFTQSFECTAYCLECNQSLTAVHNRPS